MGKLNGPLQITGTVGDLTFVKTKYGIIVRRKTRLDGSRILKEAAFSRQRQNMAEFSTASRASKLLRQAVAGPAGGKYEASLSNRMTAEMLKIVKADPINPKGKRVIWTEGLQLLEGFEFNQVSRLDNVLMPEVDIAEPKGKGMHIDKVRIPAGIKAPEAATDFEIVYLRLCADFAGLQVKERAQMRSDILPLKKHKEQTLLFKSKPFVENALPIIVLAGIRFFQNVNGAYHDVNNGRYNALSVVRVLIPLRKQKPSL